MLDGVLDPMYPYDPQFQCERCDRGIDKMDERSVLELLFYPNLEASEPIRNADQRATLCPDCQQRLIGELEGLSLTKNRAIETPSKLPARCSRCSEDRDGTDEVLHGYNGLVGASHWVARLCSACASELRDTVESVLAERPPYDEEWYRPPELRRAEAAVATWRNTDTGSTTETFETLQAGDVVRLAAFRRGSRSRGPYIGMTGRVERVLTPLTDAPPATVELRTVEYELTVPSTPRDDRWRIQSGEFGPKITYADTTLQLGVLVRM